MARFELNQAGIDALIKDVMTQQGDLLQRKLDDLARQYQGRPISVVKAAVQRAFEEDGGQITDPELTQYAEVIAAGRKIEVQISL